MVATPWTIVEGAGPIVATAIHDGGDIREELVPLLALDQPGRFREEDPFTGAWADTCRTRVIVHRSRFEVDLNRPRDRAVYEVPADSWGLRVWNEALPSEHKQGSLKIYDDFFWEMEALLRRKLRQHGVFLVLDLHSYNHRRMGPDAEPMDPEKNPELNLGTGTMVRESWSHVVDTFLREMRAQEVCGRHLDIRENVKFFGGNLSRWIHETFPKQGCSLAIELKKFFMDEWSGQLDEAQHRGVKDALAAVLPKLEQALLEGPRPT